LARSRSRTRRSADIWPGFVDAISTLLLVLIFLLTIFISSEFLLSKLLTNKDDALEDLNYPVIQTFENLQSDISSKKIDTITFGLDQGQNLIMIIKKEVLKKNKLNVWIQLLIIMSILGILLMILLWRWAENFNKSGGIGG
jgi:hypothetical protein